VPVRLTKTGDAGYLIVSERIREYCPTREYRLVEIEPLLKHLDTKLMFPPLSQENVDKRYERDTRFRPPPQFAVTDEDRYYRYARSLFRGRRHERVPGGIGERP